MKTHVVSPKYLQIMQSTKVMITGACAKVLVASVIMLSLHFLHIYKLCEEHAGLQIDTMFFFQVELMKDNFSE